jgi:hypothetical protein
VPLFRFSRAGSMRRVHQHMTITFSAGDEPPVDLQVETEQMFRETAEELAKAIKKLRSGAYGDAKTATVAVRDLKAAFELVMEERTRVEKLRRQVTGAVGSQALDFDAARDEIGKRLARLRDAG